MVNPDIVTPEHEEVDIADTAEAGTPLRVEHLKLEEKPGGSGTFTPAARLIVTPELRKSGLLQTLGDRDARTLLCLLTFLTPNGRLQFTVPGVAEGMKVSEREANERLKQLSSLRWEEEPLVHLLLRDSGIGYATLSRKVLTQKQAPEKTTQNDVGRLPYRPVGRQAVVEWSRRQYGRPREAVERQVLEQLGHGQTGQEETNSTAPEGDPRRRLLWLGVPAEQADLVLAHHSVKDITDQLDWLPLREAKHPARFVVAAIQGKYEPPARVRLQRAIAADEAREAEAKEQTAAIAETSDGIGNLDEVQLPIPAAAEGPQSLFEAEEDIRSVADE